MFHQNNSNQKTVSQSLCILSFASVSCPRRRQLIRTKTGPILDLAVSTDVSLAEEACFKNCLLSLSHCFHTQCTYDTLGLMFCTKIVYVLFHLIVEIGWRFTCNCYQQNHKGNNCLPKRTKSTEDKCSTRRYQVLNI